MGTEHTWTNWRRYFKTVSECKAAAEKDYKGNIEWDRNKGPTCNFKPIDFTCSGDLGHVMYHIKRIKPERNSERLFRRGK